jgi:hypothetical protein
VTTHHGYRYSTSVGGTLTGRGGNIVIIDDPIKPEDAISETTRSCVNEWFDNTLYSRLDDKRQDVIILIMQRLCRRRGWLRSAEGTLGPSQSAGHR